MTKQTTFNFLIIKNSLTRIQAEVSERPDVGADAPFVRMVERMMTACDQLLALSARPSPCRNNQDDLEAPVSVVVPIIKRGIYDDAAELSMARDEILRINNHQPAHS